MKHLLAATDKFRGTASALEVCTAVTSAARGANWSAAALPLSDGGEGFLEAMGAELRRCRVTGPLGELVEARWGWLEAQQVAVIEMAEAAGLVLAGGASGNDPIHATTAGVGELLLAAFQAGARDFIVGCGGSATTDGGLGAVRAIQAGGGLPGAHLRVATDVQTPFLEAAAIFAPQKGARPEMVALLAQRLEAVATQYQREFGVDVRGVVGGGAAGGLAGGLWALGASIHSGFAVVAETLSLEAQLQAADVVVTGEGKLDASSFAGKVVGEVLRLSPARARVLIVVGEATPEGLARAVTLGAGRVTVVSLSERFGRQAALTGPLELIQQVTQAYLATMVF